MLFKGAAKKFYNKLKSYLYNQGHQKELLIVVTFLFAAFLSDVKCYVTSAKNMTTWNTQISTKKCVMKFVSSSLWHEYKNKPPLFKIMLCISAFLSGVLRLYKMYISCNFYLIHHFYLIFLSSYASSIFIVKNTFFIFLIKQRKKPHPRPLQHPIHKQCRIINTNGSRIYNV